MRVALFTFGVFRERADHPVNKGFHDRDDLAMAEAEAAPGFIARSGYGDDLDPPSWGPHVWPDFYRERGDGWTPATLSLWQDPAAIAAFAYRGVHGDAVRMGREWFVQPEWPPYVIWWVAESHRPNWAEAAAKHSELHENGPTPRAFELKTPFDAFGSRTKLDVTRWLRR